MLESALGVCLVAPFGIVVKVFAKLGFEGRVVSIHKRHESALCRLKSRVGFAHPQLETVKKQNCVEVCP
jgi:hypothetical protein